jgi:uncharacterized protein DUF5995
MADMVTLLAQPVANVQDVLRMMAVLDQSLPDEDGVKWFNRLYWLVTQNIARHMANAAEWQTLDWLSLMTPVFAQYYFRAVQQAAIAVSACPRAWRPLFQQRRDRRVARLQFALAGMNAHINRDLPYALVDTFHALHRPLTASTPEHADYEHVNDILEESERQVMHDPMERLTEDIGGDLGPLVDVVAMWSVRAAREAAWHTAELLWAVPDVFRGYMETLDRTTGLASRLFLRPVVPGLGT